MGQLPNTSDAPSAVSTTHPSIDPSILCPGLHLEFQTRDKATLDRGRKNPRREDPRHLETGARCARYFLPKLPGHRFTRRRKDRALSVSEGHPWGYGKPYDLVWTAVVESIRTSDLSLASAEKESGRILAAVT